MNKVTLIGRLTQDPKKRQTLTDTPFCNFIIAVERRYKDRDGNKIVDFVNCVAWRQTAEFVTSFACKGTKVAVFGYIQTRKYEDDAGNTVYVTEVVADEVEVLLSSARPAEAPSKEEARKAAESLKAELQKKAEIDKIPNNLLPFEL